MPVSISNQLEFYLGVRPTIDGIHDRYDGARLFFDSEEFSCVSGIKPHSVNQLWRFERAAGYPKGVHAIASVATGQMMRIAEGHVT